MEAIEPLEAVSPVASVADVRAIDSIERIDHLDRLDRLDPIEPTDPPYATWAAMPTSFDPYPAVLDPAAAWFAAAASARNLQVFQQGIPPRRKRRS